MHPRLLPLALACLLSACTQAPGKTSIAGLSLVSEAEGGRLLTTGAVSVLDLQGSYREMGRQYGTLLRGELGKVYESLVQYYTEIAESHRDEPRRAHPRAELGQLLQGLQGRPPSTRPARGDTLTQPPRAP